MMFKFGRGLVLFFSLLLAGSFLSGAGIFCRTFYSAPPELSGFVITLLSMIGLSRFIDRIFMFFFSKKYG